MANQHTDGWTEEDIDFLLDNVGKITFNGIGMKIGRTAKAVESKLLKLGVTSTKLESGFIAMYELSRTLGVDNKVVKRWFNKGLPFIRKNLRYRATNKNRKRLFYYINIQDFWDWAEENKELINFYKLPKNALPPEPEWVDERRKIDYHRWKVVRTPWTPEQDKLLWKYFYEDGLPQKEIAGLFGRTKDGVEKRLKKLREMGYNGYRSK